MPLGFNAWEGAGSRMIPKPGDLPRGMENHFPSVTREWCFVFEKVYSRRCWKNEEDPG